MLSSRRSSDATPASRRWVSISACALLIARRTRPASFGKTRATESGSAPRTRWSARRSAPSTWVVRYIVPIEGNEEVPGFDIASEPVRRRALTLARDTGVTTATGGIDLIQEKGAQVGVLVCRPIYRAGPEPKAPAERDEALVGYAVGVLRVGQLVDQVMRGLDPHTIAIDLVDCSAGPALGVTQLNTPPMGALASADLAFERTISFAGRSWRARCSPTPGDACVAPKFGAISAINVIPSFCMFVASLATL